MSRPASARWRGLQRDGLAPDIRIRLLGSFTLDTLVPHLGLALHGLGICAEITVGPFNQILQECADPQSETAQMGPDMLVVWARLEETGGGTAESQPDIPVENGRPSGLNDVVSAAKSAAARLGSRLVVVLPATPADRPLGAGDASSRSGAVAAAAAARERVRAGLAGTAGTVVCDADDVMRALGEAASYDRRFDILAGIPYSGRFLEAMGDALARAVRLILRPARKVLVLDADGTLWGGAVGELGAEGVDLGPGPGAAYPDFHRFLLHLRSAGTLLALCSKNNAGDVWAVFRRREMRLRPEHLSASRIGWRPKSAAIAEIAAELNVGTDAMVLIDDNAAELAEVKSSLPGLATVLMPNDPVRWRETVDDAVFDRLPPDQDDEARPKRVADDRQREELRRTVAPEAYLQDLGIWATGRPAEAGDGRRLAQLVLKTNQMNLNGRRLSEPELARLCQSREHVVRVFEVGDRFGDYGQVGAYLLAVEGRSARLMLFIVSCRALGRGVERVMVADAFEMAGQRGLGQLVARVEKIPRNEPARMFFAAIGCRRPGEESVLDPVEFPTYVVVRRCGAGDG